MFINDVFFSCWRRRDLNIRARNKILKSLGTLVILDNPSD